MVRKRDPAGGGGTTSPSTTSTTEKPDDKSGKNRGPAGGVESPTSSSPGIGMRDALYYIEKHTGIPSASEDFYYIAGHGYMKVPVRDKSIGHQPIPENRMFNFGLSWGRDGTITTPISPVTGLAYTSATHAALSYDPSSDWQDGNWYKSIGGIMYYSLSNYVRSNNTLTAAQKVTIVKALVAYLEIAMATILFYTYYLNNIDGRLNGALNAVLSSSGGSVLWTGRDDALGRIVQNLKENYFPWEMFDFLAMRPGFAGCVPWQTPWYKYFIGVPTLGGEFLDGLTRISDAWRSTIQFKHPETYLREQGLWKKFITDVVPILFNRQNWQRSIGIDFREYLTGIGWTGRDYRHVTRDWITHKFWTHPFDETLGVGQFKLPKHGVTDVVTTLKAYYWNSNEEGNIFFLHPDSYLGMVYTPFLDPFMFLYHVVNNYSANNDGASPTLSQSLQGGIAYDTSVTDLDYNEFLGMFPKMALEYQDFELVEPDPDININATIGSGANWFDLIQASNAFARPFTMPDYHWYTERKWLHRCMAGFLGISDMNDIEIYKLQRPIGADAGAGPTDQSQGDIDSTR